MNLVWQRIGVLGKNFFARYLEVLEPGPGGVVSLEPLSSSKEYAVNSRQYSFLLTPYCILLTHCCLLRGRFKGKGTVGGASPFPVADSPETTPPGPGSNSKGGEVKVAGFSDF
jgi:hypothetical protein